MTPVQGIVVIEPLKENTNIITNSKSTTRILKGKVVSIGKPLITDFGTVIDPKDYCKAGDVVYFLSYEGSYDIYKETGKEIYLVKIQDLRAIL